MQKTNTFEFQYTLSHSPVNGHFSKNSQDFVVREVPLYEFSGDGEHNILEIQKKDLTTNQALQILSENFGIKMRDFGYAGLKDKEGMTTQFISFVGQFDNKIANFKDEKLKILSHTKHKNKIRIGHLKGNNFFIRFKKILPVDALKIEQALKILNEQGFANYFGYQRFGKFGDNAEIGLEILKGEKKLKNPKMRDFLISAYQSEIFNKWLGFRVRLSLAAKNFSMKEFSEIYSLDLSICKQIYSQKQFFKLLPGDVLGHYPFGKVFLCENFDDELKRFLQRDITILGPIIGKKCFQSQNLAKKFDDEILPNQFLDKMDGTRRFAWSYLENLTYKYDKENAHFTISFFLEKGSYATIILQEIFHRDIFEEKDCI